MMNGVPGVSLRAGSCRTPVRTSMSTPRRQSVTATVTASAMKAANRIVIICVCWLQEPRARKHSRPCTMRAVIRLAIVVSHPIQYHAPLYTFLAKDGRFDLRVFYMTDRGARAYYDAFAKTTVTFDNPILNGYEYEFLRTGEPEGWWSKKTELM